LIFALDNLNVCHISTSGLVDLLTYTVCHVMRTLRWKFQPCLRLTWPSVAVIAADTLRDLVTFSFAVWPWSVVAHGGSRGQPLTKFEDPTVILSWVM